MSLIVKLALGLTLITPVAGMANGFTYEMCDVPVCNIQDTISSLRKMNSDQRGMYAINLTNKHKDSTDVKVLENLREFGKELKVLFVELGDADWVKRAAGDMINAAVFNLAKFSEINGEQLGKFYSELSNQTFRYNLISFWQSNLVKMENVKEIQELIVFADLARAHSVKVGDEDWVPRAAKSLISEATVKLVNLDPMHEGLYDVEVHGALKYIDGLAFDRIAVLDSSSSKNLVVALINTRLRVIVHTFNNAEMMGNTITGLLLSTGEMATRFSMGLDRSTGMVEGTLESTKNGMTSFSGKQLVSTRTVFDGTIVAPLTEKDILGTMQGELGGIKGNLSVRSFKENVYSATFVSDTGSILLHFQGKFFPKKGVLSLTSNEKIKLTMSLRNKNWSGFSFSTTTGTHSKAVFSTVK